MISYMISSITIRKVQTVKLIFYAQLGKPEEESAWLSLPVTTGPICQFPDNLIAPQCPEVRGGQTGNRTRTQ